MIYLNFRIIARQLKATYNFNTGYLVCDIPDNTVEIVVKIKTTFGKHTLVEDRERRTVKYRPWGRCNQPKIKMEMAKRVAPLKLRKVKKEGMQSGSSLETGTWILKGEGFGYPPKIFTDPNYPQDSEGEEMMEAHPHDEADNNVTPKDYDSANQSMPRKKVPIPNKIKFNPYCPCCTPTGYRCICNDTESDWEGMVEIYHPVPQAKINNPGFYLKRPRRIPMAA